MSNPSVTSQKGMAVIEQLNPLRHMAANEYDAFWQKLFTTVLYGFWGRFLFVALIIMSFWFGVRMRNPSLAGTCLILAAVVAYGAGIVTVAMSILH